MNNTLKRLFVICLLATVYLVQLQMGLEPDQNFAFKRSVLTQEKNEPVSEFLYADVLYEYFAANQQHYIINTTNDKHYAQVCHPRFTSCLRYDQDVDSPFLCSKLPPNWFTADS